MDDPSFWVHKMDSHWDAGTHNEQRKLRGFSDADWINFDTYIAWVIASAVEKMKSDAHTMFSFPDEPVERWEELTQAEYDVMIKGFGQWAEHGHGFDDEVPDTLNADLDEALDIFKKRFRSLSD